MKICPQCLARGAPDRCPECAVPTLELGDDARAGAVIADRFVVLDVLGRGGMGVVYRAWQRSTRRVVAVKLLRADHAGENAVQRFLREAEVTASLSCPHTVTVHDFGTTADGDLYIAMECVEGQTLDHRLRRGRLPVRLALSLIDQIALALEEAHEKGLVHRDLKPANVMVQPVGRDREFAKVLDFGVVRLLDDGQTLTQGGAGPGTPEYMSPEQAQGVAVGPASDQYALGLVLFEMLTGRRAFGGDSALKVMLQHIQKPPPRLTDHPAFREAGALDAIIQRMLAKQPEARYPDLSIARRALGELDVDLMGVVAPTASAPDQTLALAETRDSESVVSPPPVAPPTQGKRFFLNISLFGCAIQIGVAMAALALFVMWPSESRDWGQTGYTFGDIQGQQQAFRGVAKGRAAAPPAPDRPTFYGFSEVRFDVRPDTAKEAPPELRVYVHRPGEPLQQVHGVVEAFPNGAFRVQGEGRVFFGGQPGPRRVHLVLMPPGVEHASGRLEPISRLLGGVWATYDVEYQGEQP